MRPYGEAVLNARNAYGSAFICAPPLTLRRSSKVKARCNSPSRQSLSFQVHSRALLFNTFKTVLTQLLCNCNKMLCTRQASAICSKTFKYKCSALSVSGSVQVCAAFEARPSTSVDAPFLCHHCGESTRTTTTSSQPGYGHLVTTLTLHAVAKTCDDSNNSPFRRRAHGSECSEVTTWRICSCARDRSRNVKQMHEKPNPGYTTQ